MAGQYPTDIANQALDAAALDFTLGDIQEGTRPAQVLLRAYLECIKQLLQAAPWDWARREAPLTLLADATGQTPNVGTIVGSGFIYAYEYPVDCVRIRYIPWCPDVQPYIPASNIQIPAVPLTTGFSPGPIGGQNIRPARYLVTNSTANPPASQPVPTDVHGVSPDGRLVILTNVQQAKIVYTTQTVYPSMWTPLFRAALVAYLASEIAVPLAKDKKFGMAVRDEQIKATMNKLDAARAMDGNEGWFSSDIRVDWMAVRNNGWGQYAGVNGAWGGGAGDYGCWGGGWGGTCGFSNGSAY